MTSRERAIALRDQIKDACIAANLDRVLVTIDPLEAAGGYEYGVVVIVPPKLEFTSWNETVETWTLHVAAGPWDDIISAWDTLDDIIQALRAAAINVASGEPQPMLVADNEPPLPGYELELVPDPINDI